MRSIGTASFFALCLAIAGCNNGTTTATDAGNGGTDAGNGGTDTGTPATDSGTPAEDTGTPAEDTGTPVVDANVQADANLPTECVDYAGCTAATAEDHTGDTATVAITVISDVTGFHYSPACVRIHTGQTVSIEAASIHPLTDAACSPAASPIVSGSTTTQTMTFTDPGQYGYYCSFHVLDAVAGTGMAGAIIVE